MKKIDVALILGLVISIMISQINAFANNLDGIRLHILANSDSDEDQQLKLKVRDAILNEAKYIFSDSSDKLAAEEQIIDNIDKIKKIAEKTIKLNGYNYSVKCELAYMEFNERKYDSITLPAGYYDALRITIGEGKGHNWWCVMYPQFCVAPCIKDSELEAFSDEEIKILKNSQNYKVRFKCVDWYKMLRKKYKFVWLWTIHMIN